MDRTKANVTRWAVTWGYPGRNDTTSGCALAAGQTDDLTSVRKMIALKRGLDADQVEILGLVRMKENDNGQIEDRLHRLVHEYLDMTIPQDDAPELKGEALHDLIKHTQRKAFQIVELLLHSRYQHLITAEQK